MIRTELFGTQVLVKKSVQVKFYTTEELSALIGDTFDAQGLSLSEGMTRLIRFLVDVPDALKPVILRQAPGDSALVLAESVVNSRSPLQIKGVRRGSDLDTRREAADAKVREKIQKKANRGKE